MNTPPTMWRLKEAGYTIHDDGRPQIILCRSASRTPGAFDDWGQVVRCVDGKWETELFQCTVDPGLPGMLAPVNSEGTARLAPGQHRFKMGRRSKAKGGYRCLVQAAPVTVIRDNDLDDVIDGEKRDTGWFGIQFHRANEAGTTSKVGWYSLGCVVLPLSAPAFEAWLDDLGLDDLGLEDGEEILVTVLEDVRVRL